MSNYSVLPLFPTRELQEVEGDLGRCFDFLRRDGGRVWHIGWSSAGYCETPALLLCTGDSYDWFEALSDLPEGGKLCAKCAKELERRTNGQMRRVSGE